MTTKAQTEITRRGISRRGVIGVGLAAGAYAITGLPAMAQDNPMPPDLRIALEREKLGPVLGNPQGDITLTEFFDYNCPHCRTSVGDIHQLVSEDTQLRVVFREWPVFGAGSQFSARASLAALRQGKYWQFHTGLMAISGTADNITAMQVADRVGLDIPRLRRDMEDAELARVIEHSWLLAEQMGLMGTPTFIAGHSGLFGKQSLPELRHMIADARRDLA